MVLSNSIKYLTKFHLLGFFFVIDMKTCKLNFKFVIICKKTFILFIVSSSNFILDILKVKIIVNIFWMTGKMNLKSLVRFCAVLIQIVFMFST